MKGVFIDLETNGLDSFQHSVLEIAICIVDLRSLRTLHEYQTFVRISEREFSFASDPDALMINKITIDEIRSGKEIDDIKDDLVELFLSYEIEKSNSVFICQNPSFDRRFFDKIFPVELQKDIELPYHWLDLASMYWVKTCYPLMNSQETKISLSKDSIAKSLGIKPEKKPHRAMNGVKHLIECYEKMLWNFKCS